VADNAHEKGVLQALMEKRVRKDIDVVFQAQEPHDGNPVPAEKTDVKPRSYGEKAEDAKEDIKGGNIDKGYKTLFFLRT
jgi:hypothetical protein